ncbi:TolC family protein [Bremerella cremea]|uniref:TolC family protein n=1 Tax=Bremerella cremea TaxID=1031537 RepID=UPI0031F03ABF
MLRRYTRWMVVLSTCLTTCFSGCLHQCWKGYDCPDPPAYDESLIAEYANRGLKIEDPAPNVCEDDDWLEIPESPDSITPENIDFRNGYWDLSLEEAIRLALQNSQVMKDLGGVLRTPEAVVSMYDPAIVYTDGRFGEEAALSAFDATFGAGAYFESNDRRINNFTVGENGFFQQDLHNYQVNLSKRNATGGLVSLRSVTQYDYNNNPQKIFSAGWDTYIDAEVRQPLLQGAGVQFNRIAGPNGEPGFANGVLIARTRTDISLADFEIAVRNLVSDVENAYWDLFFAYRDLDVKINARNNVLEVWKKAYANVQADKKSADTEAQAREQYFRFQVEVVNALHGRLVERTRGHNGSEGGTFNNPGGVRVAERRLRFMMGLTQTNGRLIRPVTEAPVAKVNFDWSAIATEALARRPELRRQKWVIKQRELELLANRNFLMPNLDLVARYRQRGFGPTLSDQSSIPGESGALQSLTDGDFAEYQLGVEFEMPIGFRRAHSAVRSSELALARAKAILDEEEKQIMYGLSNSYAEITRAYEIMELLFNRREAANAQEATVRASYEAGKAPIDLLLEAQRRVIDSSALFNQARIDYALAIKNVHYEKGSLLEFYQVSLAEGPWPQKAYNDALMRDLNKRRAHSDFIINKAVIGQPTKMDNTLVAKPQNNDITPKQAPLDLPTPAEIDAAPVLPTGSLPRPHNPLRTASKPKPLAATVQPTSHTLAPVERMAEAPIIRAPANGPPRNITFGNDTPKDSIWLH